MRVEIKKNRCLERDNKMTEKEKMLAGMIYDANYDEELLNERKDAKELCFEYNYLVKPSETQKQSEIIKKLFGKTEENFTITAPFWCDYGYNIEIGENFSKYFDIAIDEIVSNIAYYAYGEKTGTVTVRIEALQEENGVQLMFLDSGVPYDPLTRQDPDISAEIEEREEGGLGIFLVRKTMDDGLHPLGLGQIQNGKQVVDMAVHPAVRHQT